MKHNRHIGNRGLTSSRHGSNKQTTQRLAVLCRTVFTLGILAGIMGCGEETTDPADTSRPAKLVTIGGETDKLYRYYPGTVRALERAELAFEVAGRIVALPVKEGEAVTNRQIIARLDPRDFEAAVAAEQANLNQVKADYESSKELYEKQIISKIEFLKSQRNYEVVQEKLKTALKALEESVLQAPFQGRVAQRYVDNYENVQAKQPIVSLQNLAVIEIVIDIPEQDIVYADSNTSSAAVAIFGTATSREYPVRIKEFSTQADPDTQTFRGTFMMDAPDDINILPGMSATIKIPMITEQAGSEVIVVPVGAVFPGPAGDSYVWLVNPENMQVHRQPVTIGPVTGESIVVLKGLHSGDMIVISGVHDLREGMRVRQFTVDEWK